MQIVIDYKDIDDLRRKLDEQKKSLIGTRSFDVFKPVSIRNEDLINVNKKYFTEDEMLMLQNLGYYHEPLRIVFQDTLIERKGNRITVSESVVHNAIKNITLATLGATQNKHLVKNQLKEAQDIYVEFKHLFLSLYEKRLINREEHEHE